MTEAETERELRVLLERVVPQLPAPAQRLDGVRDRVRRRRRRRAAGTATLAVSAVALAGLLVPGFVRDRARPESVPPASAPGTGALPAPEAGVPDPEGSSSLPPPTTTPTPDARTRYPEIGGMSAALPREWRVLRMAEAGFAATQPMAASKKPCGDGIDGYCSPLNQPLRPDGAVLVFQIADPAGILAAKIRGFHQVQKVELLKSCQRFGADEQLASATAATDRSSDVVVTVTACLYRATPARLQQVREAMTSVTL
ncbi:hypothetical protein [Streptomyces sp. RKAG293]|uniref:hypothetical protein n=1 Tax=Streptomyces sp. RKAG293 TaxID=2893403 RepID=UPI00203458B5|nr:hypothetical protein [Streptomyces sp. RKAG293]MCM2420525.1 hypothetical protein [Streptomyces sp. RKAG293]